MAGMLPGVECARRRGFPRGSDKRSSFSLYTASRATHLASTSPVSLSLFLSLSLSTGKQQQASVCAQRVFRSDNFLAEAARKARERLDEKLKTTNQRSWMPSPGENSRKPKESSERRMCSSLLKMAKSLRRSRKSSPEQRDDCAVCLEEMKRDGDDALIQLPCSHRFHSSCVSPWLESNSLCPCCRMDMSCYRHPT